MNTNLVKNIESLLSIIDSIPYIRFELGADYENGSEERIEQVKDRIYKIFEETFSGNETVLVYSKDWGSSDSMFGNTTPEYLYELLQGSFIESIEVTIVDEDTGEEYKRKDCYFRPTIKSLDYKQILLGVGNHEQGRKPSIGQDVYFISDDFGKMLHMYDDRGCDVYAKVAKDIRSLYENLNDWILDYNRCEINLFFNEK